MKQRGFVFYPVIIAGILSSGMSFAFGRSPEHSQYPVAALATNGTTLPSTLVRRVEKVYVGVLTQTGGPTVAENGVGPLDFDYQISNFIHHDGDPIWVGNMATNVSGHQETQLQIVFSADPNLNGSPPQGYRLTSNSDGSFVKQSKSSLISITTYAQGMSASGVPAGSYTLTVIYADGSWALHTLVLDGIVDVTRDQFGAIKMSGLPQF